MTSNYSYNQEVLKLWNSSKYNNLFQGRIPNFLETPKQGGLLTVGINPSYGQCEKQVALLNKWTADDAGSERFSLQSFRGLFEKKNDISHQDIESVLKIHKIYRQNYPYFNKFKNIADYAGLEGNWDHVDVLPVRLTNQKDVERLLQNQEDFVRQLLDLFCKYLASAKPLIIIVENAYAAKLLMENKADIFPKMDTIDDRFGTPFSEKLGAPVFYSSMLTGQRALDNGSFERLKWSVKNATQLLVGIK
jgi:hypothetical protein